MTDHKQKRFIFFEMYVFYQVFQVGNMTGFYSQPTH